MVDVIERLRRLDPIPEQLPPPPIQALLDRLEQPEADPPAPGVKQRMRDRWPRWVPQAGALVASVAVVVVIGVGALVLLGHGHRMPQGQLTSGGQTSPPGRRELISMLGVLRRPQTNADLNPGLLRFIKREVAAANPPVEGAVPDVALMRRVTTSWGEKLYLIPFKPLSQSALRALWEKSPPPRSPLRQFIAACDHETVGLFMSNGGNAGAHPASDLRDVNLNGYQGGPNGGGEQYLIRVVPDRVAKVVFKLRGQVGRVAPGAPANQTTKTVAVAVHDNVAAAVTPARAPAKKVTATWYDGNGHVVTQSHAP